MVERLSEGLSTDTETLRHLWQDSNLPGLSVEQLWFWKEVADGAIASGELLTRGR